jgi:hypothetical protein
MTDFTEVNLGDRVWDVTIGWGTVTDVHPTFFNVSFGCNIKRLYRRDGVLYGAHENRRLFWDDFPLSDPPRPKRMIKKTLWFNVYKAKPRSESDYRLGLSHSTQEEAFSLRNHYDSYVATTSIEIEEES